MSDGILTRPLQQNSDLMERPARSVALAGGAWTLVLDPEPMRVHARFIVTEGPGLVLLSPDPVTIPGPLPVGTGITQLQLHVANDLLYIGGQWWMYSGGPATCTVWEVIRLQGVY